VDYREVLNPEQFEVFSKLRELRKQIAEKESIPVYAVFTNEQLAAMVQTQADSKTKLKAIEGVGDARIDKYGEEFLRGITALTGKAAAAPSAKE
jgi:superfamily II DNA helicase RecQ